jgi:histone H1/5
MSTVIPVASKPVKVAKQTKVAPAGHVFKANMIIEALRKLNEKAGSSRQAIVKYISANFNIDPTVANKRIKKFIALGLKDGTIKQSKGTGSNGSFKIGEATINKEKEAAKKAKISAKKEAKATKPTSVKPKKAKSAKVDVSKPKKNVKKVVKPKIPKTVSTVTPTVVVPVAVAAVAPAAPKTLLKPIVKKTKVVKATKPVAGKKAAAPIKKKVVAKKTVTKKLVKK